MKSTDGAWKILEGWVMMETRVSKKMRFLKERVECEYERRLNE